MTRVLCLMTVTLAFSGGCAKVGGLPEELVDAASPISGNPDGASGNGAGTSGGSSGGTSAPSDSGNSGASSGGTTGATTAGGSGASGGGTTGSTTGGTTGAVLMPDGSCKAPYELPIAAGRGTASGSTVKGKETLSPKCDPGIGVDGPEQIYHFKAPYAAEVSVNATGQGTFLPSAYAVTACDNSASEVACGYQGAFKFNASAGGDYFLFVDSGATDLGVTRVGDTSGGYSLAVALRELVGEGKSCGTTATSPKCDATNLTCRSETAGSVCRTIVCGDGYVEGTEECDDNNTVSDDFCNACKKNGETCAKPRSLTLTAQGTTHVATVTGTTASATDDVTPDCNGNGVSGTSDQVYTFTLGAAAAVKVTLNAKFDAVLAIYRGSCPSGTSFCVDDANANETETYTANLSAGTYVIVVDAFATNFKGEYTLTVTTSP